MISQELRRERKGFGKTRPQDPEECVGYTGWCIRVEKKREVTEEPVSREVGVVEAQGEVGLGGMPLPEEIGRSFSDDVLVGRDGAIGEQEFIQGEEGGCSVQQQPRFGKVTA